MNIDLAVSTSWANNNSNVSQILEGIQEAGFSFIEVGFHFKNKEVEEIKFLLPRYSLQVVTVHNFCPFPLSHFPGFFSPDYFSLSSPDERERKLAVKYTLGTLETAYDLSARAVILHAGRVEIEDQTLKLWELKVQDNKEFQTQLNKFLNIRNHKAKKLIDCLKFSLEELLKWAQKLGVVIALESRYYLNEIPELDEMEDVLSTFDIPFLRYWHDVGHVNVRERLGLYTQGDAIMTLEKYLLGFHIHDAQGIDDHKIPGSGDIKFDFLKKYEDKFHILEVHPPVTVQDLRRTRGFWGEIFYGGKLGKIDIKS